MGSRPSVVESPLPGREFSVPQGREAYASVDDWLDLKKANDQKRLGFAPHLWCIRDSAYDLAPFLHKHPGGRSWLQLTRGMDCTGLFETHHLDIARAESLLAKFFVCKVRAAEPRRPFEWHTERSHYHALRSRVHDQLQRQEREDPSRRRWSLPSAEMHALSFAAVALWLTGFAWFVRAPSALRAVIAGLCLHPLVGVGHNFLHQADRKGLFGLETYWRYALHFTLYDVREFRVHHVLSHHTHINLDCDLEVMAFEPMVNFMANTATNSVCVFAYAPLLYFAAPLLLAMGRVVSNVQRRSFAWAHFVPLLELVVLLAANLRDSEGDQASLGSLLWCFYVMHGVANLVTSAVGVVVHRSDHCWTEGEAGGTKDFVKHVLLSTVDYAVDVGTAAGLFAFETFNDHRVHHLFPTLDASQLRQIRPLVVDFCRDPSRGLRKAFRNDGFPLHELFVGMLRNWYRIYEM